MKEMHRDSDQSETEIFKGYVNGSYRREAMVDLVVGASLCSIVPLSRLFKGQPHHVARRCATL